MLRLTPVAIPERQMSTLARIETASDAVRISGEYAAEVTFVHMTLSTVAHIFPLLQDDVTNRSSLILSRVKCKNRDKWLSNFVRNCRSASLLPSPHPVRSAFPKYPRVLRDGDIRERISNFTDVSQLTASSRLDIISTDSEIHAKAMR